MGVLTDLYNAQNPPPPEEPGLGAAAIGGLKSGAAGIAGGLAGGVASFGDVVPNIASQARALRGGIDEYQQQVARESGTDMSLGEAVSDPSALARKAVFSATSVVPQVASLYVGGPALKGLGLLSGMSRGSAALNALGTVGRVGAIAAPTYGNAFNNLQDAAPDTPVAELRNLAAAVTVPSTAAEYLPLSFLLRGGGAKAGVGLLRRIVGGAATGSVVEGATEGLQSAIGQVARTQVDPSARLSLTDPRFASDLAESIFGGMTGGGLLGGAGGAFRRAEPTVVDQPTPAQTDEAQNIAPSGTPTQPQAPQGPFVGPPTGVQAAEARRPAPLPDSAFLPPEFVGPPVRALGLPAPSVPLGLPAPDSAFLLSRPPAFLAPPQRSPAFLDPETVTPGQVPMFLGPARNLLQQGAEPAAPIPGAAPDFLGAPRNLAGFPPEPTPGQAPAFLGPARNLLQQEAEPAAPIPGAAPDFLGAPRNLLQPQDVSRPFIDAAPPLQPPEDVASLARNLTRNDVVAPTLPANDAPGFERPTREWISGSRVVDEKKRPKPAYHGTPRPGFDFIDTFGSKHGLFGQGGYFTEDPSIASKYTKKGARKGDAGAVYKVYLSIKNPLDMDKVATQADIESWIKGFNSTPDPELPGYGYSYISREEIKPGATNEDIYRILERNINDTGVTYDEFMDTMREGIESMGHDGITHMGGGRMAKNGVRHRVWIAFYPEQVRPAIGTPSDAKLGSEFAPSNDVVAEYVESVRPNLDQEPLDTLRTLATDTSALIQSRIDGYETMLYGAVGPIDESKRPLYQRYVDLGRQELAYREANPEINTTATAAREAQIANAEDQQARTFGNGRGETPIREASIEEVVNNPDTMQKFLTETATDIADPALQEARGPQYSEAIAYAPLKKMADRAVSAKNVVEKMIGAGRVAVKRSGDTSYYDRAKSVINIALGDVDPLSTAAHEGYHAAADSVLTRSENSIVSRAFAKSGAMRSQLEAAARKLWSNADTVIEHFDTPGEAEAYAYQAWARGEIKPNGIVSSAFRKIQRFFERAANLVRGEGFQDWESVFSALQAGKYAERNLLGEAWKTSDMPERMYSKAQPLPVDSSMREAQDVLEKMHELIPERSLKAALSLPDSADVRSVLKRGWGIVGSMHNVARQSAQAAKIMAQIEAQFRYRDTLVSDADTTLQSWIDTNDTKAMESAGSKLIEFTRDRQGTVKDNEIIGGKALSEMNLLDPDDVAALSAYGRFTEAQLREAGLNDAAIKLYNDGRDAMNNSMVSRALATDPNHPSFRSRELDAMRSIAEGYMPVLRHGKFAVAIKGDKGQNLGFFSFLTQQEARNAERIISEALNGYEGVDISLSTISKGSLNVNGASAADMLDLLDTFDIELNEAQRENIIKTLTAADATTRKALLRRENIPGFSRDALRTMAVFVQSNANSASKSKFAGEISKLARDKKAFRREGINGGYNQDKMIELVDYLQTPRAMDEGAIDVSSKLRTAAAMVHLGGSISGGLVNMSQLATATAPYLTQFGSPTKAYGGIVSAMRDVGGQRFSDVAHIDAEIAKLGRGRNSGFSTRLDELQALRQATAEGVLNPSRTLAIMGVSQGKALARSQSMRKFMDLWMAPQAITEGINRRTTFLAAYRIGKELQIKQPNLFGEGGRFKDAYDFANTAVVDTQGIFNKYNRPAWAREGVGAMIYTFKAYPTLMVELAANMNTKGRLMMLGTLMLSSGLTGLPFSEDLMAAAQGIAKLLGIDWSPLRVPEAALRQVLQPIQKAFPEVDTTELLMNGVLDATGISVSNRIGLGSIVPGLKGFAAGDFGKAAWDILGPAGQPPLAVGAAAGRLAQGDVLGALRSQPVKGIADIAAAVEQSMTGSQTDKYGNNIAPASIGTIMTRAIGLGSTEQARQYELANIIQDYQDWNRDMTSGFRSDMADAIRSGDTDAQRKVIDSIIAWNESHPNPRDRINLNTKELMRQVNTPTLLARRIRGPAATLRANDLLNSIGVDPNELP